MTRPPINPGRVEWSGENPGIYLKTDAGGDYTGRGPTENRHPAAICSNRSGAACEHF